MLRPALVNYFRGGSRLNLGQLFPPLRRATRPARTPLQEFEKHQRMTAGEWDEHRRLAECKITPCRSGAGQTAPSSSPTRVREFLLSSFTAGCAIRMTGVGNLPPSLERTERSPSIHRDTDDHRLAHAAIIPMPSAPTYGNYWCTWAFLDLWPSAIHWEPSSLCDSPIGIRATSLQWSLSTPHTASRRPRRKRSTSCAAHSARREVSRPSPGSSTNWRDRTRPTDCGPGTVGELLESTSKSRLRVSPQSSRRPTR